MNHQFIYIIVQCNHSYAHSPVQPMQYLHFLWNMTFLLCLSSSSACTSTCPGFIKTWRQQLLLETVRSAIKVQTLHTAEKLGCYCMRQM
jgi:hypothetical protein